MHNLQQVAGRSTTCAERSATDGQRQWRKWAKLLLLPSAGTPSLGETTAWPFPFCTDIHLNIGCGGGIVVVVIAVVVVVGGGGGGDGKGKIRNVCTKQSLLSSL